MARFLLLAQGQHIVHYAEQFRESLPDPDELKIVLAHMEHAVVAARKHIAPDTEVVLARSTSADLLREANIPVSVVEIPVSDDEIMESMKKARALAGPGRAIGFLGFRSVIASMQSFLDMLSFRVKLYQIYSTEEAHEQIGCAKRDGVAVLISGERYIEEVRAAGLQNVLMESSVGSIRRAYLQAAEIAGALALEKKKSQETRTIFNSVSDAIVSLDADGRFTLLNRNASLILEQNASDLEGRDISLVFTHPEQRNIKQVLATGEEIFGVIMERKGRQYAMRIVPIVVDKRPDGAVITLQEIRALQRMEATVRKGLYQKGNVAQYHFDDIIGRSPGIREAVATARSFAPLQSNILITGETGTGKELFAQSVHNASSRRDRPFVAVNCGAIPPHLVESELFGYEDGAFTGAKKGGKMGLFELAHGGTIFLDEISEMDQASQVNLLRALQERQIRRVGGNNQIPVDVRVVAACNANLHDMVRDNRFRQDLYYRLSVLVIHLPPLRERPDDVSLLANHFVELYNRQFGKNIAFSDAARLELESFSWDGNIRQLRNFCERITAIAEDPVVGSQFVQKQYMTSFRPVEMPTPAGGLPAPSLSVPAAGATNLVMIRGAVYDRGALLELLKRHDGNRGEAAKSLGISRTTLWKHLKQLGVRGGEFAAS